MPCPHIGAWAYLSLPVHCLVSRGPSERPDDSPRVYLATKRRPPCLNVECCIAVNAQLNAVRSRLHAQGHQDVCEGSWPAGLPLVTSVTPSLARFRSVRRCCIPRFGADVSPVNTEYLRYVRSGRARISAPLMRPAVPPLPASRPLKAKIQRRVRQLDPSKYQPHIDRPGPKLSVQAIAASSAAPLPLPPCLELRPVLCLVAPCSCRQGGLHALAMPSHHGSRVLARPNQHAYGTSLRTAAGTRTDTRSLWCYSTVPRSGRVHGAQRPSPSGTLQGGPKGTRPRPQGTLPERTGVSGIPTAAPTEADSTRLPECSKPHALMRRRRDRHTAEPPEQSLPTS